MPRPRTLLTCLACAAAFAPAPRTKARLVDRQVRWPWQKKTQAEEGEGGDDITNSPVFLQKKVGVLQNELKQLDVDIAAAEAKKAANWDEWGSQIENMRNEFAAVKKRTQEARTRAEAVERAGVLDQLLGPIDNFDRAIVAQKTRADASEGVQKVVDRYTGPVAQAFDEAFEELGAEKIDETGVPFDPTIHEAAMTDFDADAEPDTVIKVFQYGVKVGDRLIRPATVVVSM